MTKKKKELENLKIYETAKKVFKDADYFGSEKMVIGFYNLLKRIAKTKKLNDYSSSLFSIYQVLGRMDKKFYNVIYYRYIDNLTLEECGRILGCSRETVRTREIKAIQLLRAHIKALLTDYEMDLIKRKAMFKEAIISGNVSNDDILIEDLNLSIRTYNALLRANIHTASQLFNLTNEQLLSIKNAGPKLIREINFAKSKLLNEVEQKQLTLLSPD